MKETLCMVCGVIGSVVASLFGGWDMGQRFFGNILKSAVLNSCQQKDGERQA